MSELLTIQDLAKRWGLPLRAAKRACHLRGVPYIPLRGTPKLRTPWNYVRFRLDAIEAWERANEVIDDNEPQLRPAPTRNGVSRLGNWQK